MLVIVTAICVDGVDNVCMCNCELVVRKLVVKFPARSWRDPTRFHTSLEHLQAIAYISLVVLRDLVQRPEEV